MNMIFEAKQQVLHLTQNAYAAAAAEGLLPEDCTVVPSVEIPKDTRNGDYTTTFCLAAAKAMHKNPREVAAILRDHMALEGSYFTSVEIAGPGFLNFTLGGKWFADTVKTIEAEGDAYGKNDTLKGKNHSMTIPVGMVTEFRNAIASGKKLKDLVLELSAADTRLLVEQSSALKKSSRTSS